MLTRRPIAACFSTRAFHSWAACVSAGITVQQIVLEAEPGLQGRIPCCIVKHESTRGTAPVVIWLHATGASTVAMLPRLYNYAALGFLAVSMDCRYHGARTPAEDNGLKYQEAVFKCVSIWQAMSPRCLVGQHSCSLAGVRLVCRINIGNGILAWPPSEMYRHPLSGNLA